MSSFVIDDGGYLCFVVTIQKHNWDWVINLKKVMSKSIFIMANSGFFHTMIIDEERNMWGCGSNTYGQLGFEKVGFGKRFVMVSCGYNYTMTIDSDGNLWVCD